MRALPVLSLICATALAQTPPSQPHGLLQFRTSVGSFKLLGAAEQPVEGRLSFNFNGSVLVSGLQGKVVTEGPVRLEKDVKNFDKKVYFGRGKMTVTGRWRAVQFFGRDVKGDFDGWGVFRLYGEFDNTLDTGVWKRPGEPEQPWGTGGMQVMVPAPGAVSPTVQPKVRKVGG